jgi:coenzyme F420 hydrogenase subunit beta
MSAIRGIRDVAERHLCAGCGACAFLAPDAIEMVDDLRRGRRPLVKDDSRAGAELLAACPGYGLAHEQSAPGAEHVAELFGAWGPIRTLWEGFAGDPELRFAGSSGGAASALALWAIERAGFHGLLHIAARPDVPYLNRTVLSTTRAEILAATGSRYAPASPCDGLQLVVDAPGPCVFIGKPCDVAAARSASTLRPALEQRLGLTIAIFCAGTPSTAGTLEMLARMGFDDPSRLASLRYRGNGWPGRATARGAGAQGEREASLSYEQSWGEILQKHRPWRCYVCADHTGEFADIAVGDPWYREIPPGEPGRSLVLARSERGARALQAAMEAGYLVAEPVAPEILRASQPNLEDTRGAVWGRIWATRMLGAAAPRYRNLALFPTWWKRLSAKQKLRSFLGTFKRTFTKRLRERVPVRAWKP